MQLSKLLLRTFLVVNTAMVMTACTLPTPQDRDSEGSEAATFLVSDATGESIGSKLNADFSVPESKTFTFSVCLKDRAQSKPLVGHPFKVDEIDKEMKTDEKGCLNWKESVPFNYFSNPQYLEWQRHVTATGLHKGSRLVRFAINPWSDIDNSKPVVNLNTTTPFKLETDSGKVTSLLKGADESNFVKNSLWVNDMRLQSYDQKFSDDGSVTLNFDLMAVPRLKMKALNGDQVLQPLNQGKFKFRLSLIHALVEGGKEVRRILGQSEIQNLSVYNGNMFIKAPLKLPLIPSRGQIILGLDITAQDSSLKIGNFQGIYLIGDYDQLKTTGFLRLMSFVTEKEDFKISDYVNSTEKFENKDAYVKPRIEIAPLEIRSVRVGKETTSEKEIIYNIRACLRNGLEQKIIRGHTFNVTGFRQNEGEKAKTKQITTDNSACVNWDDSLTFKHYACQKYLKGFVEIENKDLALKQRLEIAINPWQSNGLTFGRDLRYLDNQERLITDCKQENVLPSAISLRSFSYSAQSYGYDIDHYLNMTFKKKLRLKVDAVVSVFNDMTFGRMESAQKLRPGVYLLKIALIKNRDYYNEKIYVTSAEKLVSTVDGDIKADIEFKTSDLKALSNRNTVLIELDPVQESKVVVDTEGHVTVKEPVKSLDDVIDRSVGLLNRTFTGIMLLNPDRDSQELMPLNTQEVNQYLVAANLPKLEGKNTSMVRGYIELGQKIDKEQQLTLKRAAGIPAFAQRNSLAVASVKNPESYPALQNILIKGPSKFNPDKATQELLQFATTGKLTPEMTKGMCAYWYRELLKDSVWETYLHLNEANCGIRAGKPANLFKVEKRLFVKELGGFKYVKGYPFGVGIDNSISLTKTFTESFTTTKSLSASVGLSQKWLDLFSIGVTGTYSIATAEADAFASANAVSVRSTLPLTVHQNIYQLNLKRYQECSIVTMNPQLFKKGGLFESALKPNLKEAQKIEVASRGLMICTGEDTTKPLVSNESYYFVNQDVNSSSSQDSGDDRNRNFVIALRGEKDFQRLMYFIQDVDKPNSPHGNGDESTKKMLNNLDVLINTGLPNTPGTLNDTP